MRRFAGIGLILVSSASFLAQERRDQSTFQAGVELVQLDVSVLDEKRQPVRGLGVADFTVLENGVPRPIRAFSAVDIPAPASGEAPVWANTVVPDVATNQAAAQEGRLVIILMDRSIPYQGPSVMAQKIAVAAVEALGPNDLGALVSTSGPYKPQNFTADRGRLVTAIMQRDWSTESTGYLWSLDEGGDGRCLCGLCVLETVTRISEAVRDAPRRRKLLLFIGRGLVVNSPPRAPSADLGCEHPLKLARQKLYDSLAVSNLTVHSIDPRGLDNIGDHTRASVSGAGLDMPGPRNGPAVRLQQLTGARNDMLRTQESLRILPDRTGGRTVVNTNAPEELIPAIFRESEAYYLVGFERDPAGKADARRSIEVKVARKGARAYAQRQYMPAVQAATPATPAVTPDATVGGLLPNPATRLALNTTAFAKPEGKGAVVTIQVDAGALAGESPTPLDVNVIALDQAGQQVGSAKQTSTLAARSSGTAVTGPVDVQSHIDLDPGDYEVRVAVTDRKTRATGSVFSQIAIPDFSTGRLSVSDIAVELGQASNGAAGVPVPVLPTTRRTFARGDQVRAFLQVYQGTGRTDPIVPVSIRVRILDARGGATRDQSLVFSEKEFRARRADCRINLPIDGLPAGE